MSDAISEPAQPSADVVARREQLERRLRTVALLKIGLPGFAAAVFAAVLISLAYQAIMSKLGGAGTGGEITKLTSPQLQGTDNKGNPFVITAQSATRDPKVSNNTLLDHPVLVSMGDDLQQTKITAAKGVYDEEAGRLAVSGGVKFTGGQGDFDTPSSVFDTKTGKIVGDNNVQGSGSFGDIKAGSYEGENSGKQIIYKGGVRGQLHMQTK